MTPARLSQVLNHTSLHELFPLVLDIGGPFREGLILLLANIPTISLAYFNHLCYFSFAAQLPAGFFQWEIKAGNQMTGEEGVRILIFLALSPCWFAVVGCTPPPKA